MSKAEKKSPQEKAQVYRVFSQILSVANVQEDREGPARARVDKGPRMTVTKSGTGACGVWRAGVSSGGFLALCSVPTASSTSGGSKLTKKKWESSLFPENGGKEVEVDLPRGTPQEVAKVLRKRSREDDPGGLSNWVPFSSLLRHYDSLVTTYLFQNWQRIVVSLPFSYRQLYAPPGDEGAAGTLLDADLIRDLDVPPNKGKAAFILTLNGQSPVTFQLKLLDPRFQNPESGQKKYLATSGILQFRCYTVLSSGDGNHALQLAASSACSNLSDDSVTSLQMVRCITHLHTGRYLLVCDLASPAAPAELDSLFILQIWSRQSFSLRPFI
eukprot:NODE_1458_length_1409_cov_7.940441_g1213_i0.p1 GENE.NODE_1458_length_1409_cov_7.940441_g1213_i0~~NODE_1458_length_1409_cov_7.940441_g1213_i0.p1  ORF type:complete len:352 (-),score=123.88 NODE_1458_length_1409_cov_7.940441_g1213_i0:352-1335(-)